MEFFLGGILAAGVLEPKLFDASKFVEVDEISGKNVGLASTSLLYFVGQNDWDLSVALTASHNPAEFVGAKFFDRGVTLLESAELREIFREVWEKWENSGEEIRGVPGNSRADLVAAETGEKALKYLDFLAEKFGDLTGEHKIVVDLAHGAATGFERKFLENLAEFHEIALLHAEPRGDFGGEKPEASGLEDFEKVLGKMAETGARLGLKFDGDADRLGVVLQHGDGRAEFVAGDVLTGILGVELARESASRNEELLFLHDCMTTRATSEEREKIGVKTAMTRVGRFFINRDLKKMGADFAGELSGHFLWGELGGYEAPLLALALLLRATEHSAGLANLVRHRKSREKTPLENFVVAEKEKMLEKIAGEFAEFAQSRMDGLRVEGEDRRFIVRPSNTENKLRFVAESKNPAKTAELAEKIRALVADEK